jgi:hypothetical protein
MPAHVVRQFHTVQGIGGSGRAWQVAQAAHGAAPAGMFGGSVGRQSAPAASYNSQQLPSPPDPQVQPHVRTRSASVCLC